MTIPRHGSDTHDPEFGKALVQAMENYANDPQPPVFDAPAMVGRARRRRRLLVSGAAAAVVVLGAGVAFGAQAARPGTGRVNPAAAGPVASPTNCFAPTPLPTQPNGTPTPSPTQPNGTPTPSPTPPNGTPTPTALPTNGAPTRTASPTAPPASSGTRSPWTNPAPAVTEG
ncbi:hypothetical protein LN042_06155 [Kitasatospora sp. RB6PN24]|uniref:hypothetical protein n=1 Tax=Kitasatospora humi TaxID=2893891 RepID=UPI001E2EAD78|nr:hypothetical protein [Kitasatospora humi]MCC9306693.1 hypothetical protein [Kitasatospora humi]